MSSASRASRSSVLVLVLVLLATLVAGEQSAQARSHDRYRPGHRYSGDFPDPSVLRVGAKYVAYGTSTGGRNLPVLQSRNLRRWNARPASRVNPAGDALIRVARWARGVRGAHGRVRGAVWAPAVTRVARHRYLLAYATRVRKPHPRRGRMCVSVAVSRSPLGPFRDRSRRPVVCPRRGAIDPQIYRPPGHRRPWLLWKVDSRPARILIRPMNLRGTRLLPGSRTRVLVRPKQRWEGRIVENPGMIRYRGRFYLFYSGNRYASRKYAVGYLICRTWRGGCHRPRRKPLLASRGRIVGPGGAAPFVDRRGRLRLVYHAWQRGKVGYSARPVCRRHPARCGQRKLYVATVRPGKAGVLRVVRRR
ncbi:MAG: family 43 glycosylhydrolase [Nocardioidaceae bacterium]|nr:family 43 glycosylhydrolase [Nocardioidaceae bacterium]